jgi:hypothetical protein
MHQHMLYNYHRQTAVQCERFERRFLIDQAAYNARMNAAANLAAFIRTVLRCHSYLLWQLYFSVGSRIVQLEF